MALLKTDATQKECCPKWMPPAECWTRVVAGRGSLEASHAVAMLRGVRPVAPPATVVCTPLPGSCTHRSHRYTTTCSKSSNMQPTAATCCGSGFTRSRRCCHDWLVVQYFHREMESDGAFCHSPTVTSALGHWCSCSECRYNHLMPAISNQRAGSHIGANCREQPTTT